MSKGWAPREYGGDCLRECLQERYVMWPRSPAKCSLLAIAVLGRIYGKDDRMDLQKLTGSIVALVTPFNEDGSID